jgi:hypothetical protein
MYLYVLQEEGAEPKPLIHRLDEAEGRIKGLHQGIPKSLNSPQKL